MRARTTLALTGALVVAGGAAAAPTAAQDPVALRHRTAFPESFGYLQAVRELPDGRVMVADPLGGTLSILDLRTGGMTAVGREGQGPGEWRQPDAVHALPGDSTLLVDLGNARLTVIDPAGRFVATHPMALGQPGMAAQGPRGLDIVQPRGVDASGRVYFQARPNLRGGGAVDSAAVKRWSRVEGDAPVRVVGLRPPAVSASSGGGDGGMQVRMRPVPLAPQDDWAVAPDGRVAVIRAEPYRVEWHAPDGSVARGPEVRFTPVRVGEAEKQRWLDEAAGTGVSMNMEIGGGGATMRLQRGGSPAAEARASDYEWPETLPAFRSGAAVVDPAGRVWVARYAAVGQPSVYDVFDRRGVRTARYRLPADRRILAITERAIYAVRVDELGLNWLDVYEPTG